MIKKISVVGAGTMGSGISLAAALKHYRVILCDINNDVLESAKSSIEKNLQVLEQRQKISPEEKLKIQQSITFTNSIDDCVASVVIEAIVEKIEVKENLFYKLAAINSADTILASNTSSLSITRIQKNIPHPQRVAGLHFFNPAPIMKLVEVVKGNETSDATVDLLMELCRQMDKIPVLCKDMPGFIVNRIARHYYLEAMHLVQNNLATIESVDAAMVAVGFKMGPFSLMDLIGMDVNLAVSTSLYEAFDHAERFKPSALQIEKVQKGELGKKTGIGFYAYNKPL